MTEAWTDEEVTWYRMNGSTGAVKRWLATLDAAREEIAILKRDLSDTTDECELRGENLTKAEQLAKDRHYVCEAHVPTEPSDEQVCPCCEAVAIANRLAESQAALRGFKWLGNNLHNITADPDQFKRFYESALADAENALAPTPTGEGT